MASGNGPIIAIFLTFALVLAASIWLSVSEPPVTETESQMLAADTSAKVRKIAMMGPFPTPRMRRACEIGPAGSCGDHQFGVHAAHVVALHVAEEDVTAGSQVHLQVPEGAGPARLERTGLTLQRFLADGQAIRAHRQGMAGGARDDQLVFGRPFVVNAQGVLAGRETCRAGDMEVPLGNGDHAPGRRARARAPGEQHRSQASGPERDNTRNPLAKNFTLAQSADRGETFTRDTSMCSRRAPAFRRGPAAGRRGYSRAMDHPEPTTREWADVLLKALGEGGGMEAAHFNQVAQLARVTCEHLEIPAHQVPRVALAARLHDIGQVAVPAAILQKPGPLDAQEWEIMRTHAEAGERILAAGPSLSDVALLVRHHHERHDGTGYPDGLRGERTPPGLVGHRRLRRVRGDDEAAALQRRDHRRRGHRRDPPVLGLAVHPRGRRGVLPPVRIARRRVES